MKPQQPGAHDLPGAASGSDDAVRIAILLRQAARDGRVVALLRGRHVGLICDDECSMDARAFRSAITALGARVARLARPAEAVHPEDTRRTGRWLDRLYEAIECQGLSEHEVARVRLSARIPVFDGLTAQAGQTPPPAALRDVCDNDAQARFFLLQGLVISRLR